MHTGVIESVWIAIILTSLQQLRQAEDLLLV